MKLIELKPGESIWSYFFLYIILHVRFIMWRGILWSDFEPRRREGMCVIGEEETFVGNVWWGWGLLMVGDMMWRGILWSDYDLWSTMMVQGTQKARGFPFLVKKQGTGVRPRGYPHVCSLLDLLGSDFFSWLKNKSTALILPRLTWQDQGLDETLESFQMLDGDQVSLIWSGK